MRRFEPVQNAVVGGAVETPAGGEPTDMEAHLVRGSEFGSDRRRGSSLSDAQRRVWFLEQLEGGQAAFTVSGSLRLDGKLDLSLLGQIFPVLEQRHPILQASFIDLKGQPRQSSRATGRHRECVIDLSALQLNRCREVADRLEEQLARRPIDTAFEGVWRSILLRLEPQVHRLVLSLHRLVGDQRSVRLLAQDVCEIYGHWVASRPLTPPPAVRYKDRAGEQRRRTESGALQASFEYWSRRLESAPALLELPTDRPRPATQSLRTARLPLTLAKSLSPVWEKLNRLPASRLKLKLLMAFEILLHRTSGKDDLVVAVSADLRSSLDAEAVIGPLSNRLLLRADFSGDPDLPRLEELTRQELANASAHGDIPFEALVEHLRPERDRSRNPLAQVLFDWRPSPSPVWAAGELRAQLVLLSSGTSELDLSLALRPTAAGISGYLEYDRELFDATTVRRLLHHYEAVLRQVVVTPQSRLSELDVLSPAERHMLLCEWNDTRGNATFGGSLLQRFEAQARAIPDTMAIVCGEQALTYGELNARADRLGHVLRQRGLRSEQRVAIFLNRSLDLVVAIFATLKAGGAYLPLDPAYPSRRLTFMLHDAKAVGVLTSADLVEVLPNIGDGWTLCLDRDAAEIRTSAITADAALPVAPSPDDLAYLIYTSGSTGRAKGVAISHRSANALVDWALQVFSGVELERVVAATSVCFDLSIFELFVTLSRGGQVLLIDDALALREVRHRRPTLINTVPGAIDEALRSGAVPASIQTINLAGEALPRDLAERVHEASGRRLLNLYGPSEDTTYSTWAQIEARGSGPPSIGRPITETRMSVADSYGRVAIGVPGELYLGGVGLARGYLERPALTAERFLPDGDSSAPGQRFYRTGDLVRYRRDGALEFLGRLDHQVKLRGYRIELGEVETALRAHPSVHEAVVLVRGTRLIAYLTVGEPMASDEELRAFMGLRLPEYMLPSIFERLDALPRMPNGKVDRSSLARSDQQRAADSETGRSAAGAAPQGATEEVLAGIWADVLEVEQVSADDHFFHLGGHSLMATRILSRVREAFAVDLPVGSLFAAPTLREFGHHLEQTRLESLGASDRPLIPASRTEPLPLSFAQQQIWLFHRVHGKLEVYNVAESLRLTGQLRPSALEQALDEIVRRHEVLRTRLRESQQEPYQDLRPHEAMVLPVVDLEGLRPTDRRQVRRILSERDAQRPLDPSHQSVYAFTLLRLAAADHELLLTLHHVATDGWSMEIFYRELDVLYCAFADGKASPLRELSVQYADFASWLRDWLQPELLDQQISYWRRQLADLPAVLELPLDRPRPTTRNFRGDRLSVRLEPALATALHELSRRRGLTLTMTLLVGLQVLLARLCSQRDIAVGVPSANRRRRETEEMIGFFVNMLVMRADLSGDPDLPTLQRRARRIALEAYSHQDVPFDRLVEELLSRPEPSRSPLFQVLFQWQSPSPPSLGSLGVQHFERGNGTAKFDLEWSLTETPAGIGGYLEYDRELFDATTVRRMLRQYRVVLQQMVAAPRCRLSQLNGLNFTERHQLHHEWSDTYGGIPGGAGLGGGLLQRFEAQARAIPEAIAIVCNERALTYGELDARAERIGHVLRQRGIRAERRVAIFLDRSLDMVVAIFATLKAGGAYLPLDPTYPQRRLAFMLQDARAAGVLTTTDRLEDLPEAGDAWTFCLDRDAARGRDSVISGSASLSAATTDRLAYLIYTSGSTGRAKGVAISHRSANALVDWALEVFSSEELERVVAATSICFDLSVFELFVPLAGGGQVLLIDDALALGTVKARRPTLVNTVPGAIDEALRSDAVPPSVRTVNLAGEALPRDLADRVFERSASQRLLNLYGPSEDTTYSTWAQIEARSTGAPPIGRPITETRASVVDGDGSSVPIGVAGELYLGGVGLARGYLERPKLTAERFLPDGGDSALGGRLYRTGDLVRHRRDGTLDFLGRLDHQVKLRGYRIELGEVETVLRTHPSVHEAVVLVRGTRLVAYLTVEEPAGSDEELRAFMELSLPEYMVPSTFERLDVLPRMPNGKIDRSTLTRIDRRKAADAETPRVKASAAPQGAIEEVLASIWAQVLEVEHVPADGHFFHLGGHSLMATRALSRIREALGVEVPVSALFAAPTLREFGRHLEQARLESVGVELLPLVRQERRPPLPLSLAQQSIWVLEQAYPSLGVHLISAPYHLQGALDRSVLAHALHEIVQRHEVLRSRILRADDGLPVQEFSASRPMHSPVPVVDLSSLNTNAGLAEGERLAFADAARPFDLSGDPLLRTILLQLGPDDHVLLLTLHHLVADGWSIGILARELGKLYTAFASGHPSPLSELPLQVADVTLWQRQWLHGEALASQLAFWREQLAGAPSTLELPYDRPRPVRRGFRGARLAFEVSRDLDTALRQLSRDRSTTLFMTLLAGFQALLHLSTGQPDLVVGTAYANRARREIEDLIGFFVNTLALRVRLDGDLEFGSLLDRVRTAALAAHGHQDVPFDRVVAELAPERDPSRSPIFQIFFHLLDVSTELELPGLRTRALEQDNGSVEFDLELTMVEDGPRLRGFFDYNRDLFDATTIHRLRARFLSLLSAATSDPADSLALCGQLAAAQRQQLLIEWNDTAGSGQAVVAHQWITRQAQMQPDAIALAEGALHLSFCQLDIRANRLAHELRARGVARGHRVALLLERSMDAIVGMLAVLKAGAAYLPLDPSHPRRRLAGLLADAGVCCVLTRGSKLAASDLPSGILRLDADAAAIAARPGTDPGCDVSASDLAYVIYTSGSTGRPKGVGVNHGSLAHYSLDAIRDYALESGDRVLQFASLTFDASVEEIYPTLCRSATLVLRTPQMLSSPAGFLAHCHDLRISVLGLPTAFWHQLAVALADAEAELPSAIRLVIIGGEKAQPESLNAWHRARGNRDVRLVNTYGPTETTVVVSRSALERPSRHPAIAPPIGRPITDTGLHVLDGHLRTSALGVSGALFVSGRGLARGYLERPILSAESFIPNPFSKLPGTRLYATGDRVRSLADGALEILGRIDGQEKIRGFRIEPEEIESVLETHPAVRQAGVVVREGTKVGHRSLVAWVVPVAEPVSAAALRDFLRDRLPPYMVPSVFANLEAIPATTAGKIDRGALKVRSLPRSAVGPRQGSEGVSTPSTPLEAMLADIWSEVLGRPVGVEDDFFELGGHSLLATMVLSRIQIVLGRDLPMRTLFTHPTIRGLAAAFEEDRGEDRIEPPPLVAVGKASSPLSFGQQRLWFLSQAFAHPEVYQIPEAWRLEGDLAPSALEHALAEIVRRHEVLRSRVIDKEDGPRQVIEPTGSMPLPLVDLTALSGAAQDQEARDCSLADAQSPLDLASGRPMRATLLRLKSREHLLFVTLHHAVADGWSMDVFSRELATLYRSFAAGNPSPLPELSVQYGDFAAWQRRWLRGPALDSLLAFWQRHLAGAPSALELPIDRPRPAELTYRGGSLLLPLPRRLQQTFGGWCRQQGVTAFMAELAALQLLLARHAGTRDVVVGSPIANRDRREIEGVIGFFVNTLPLRLDLTALRPGGEPTVEDLLAWARESVLEAYAHRELPFEKLVEEMQVRRDTSRTPIFQVFFQRLAAPADPPDFGALSCRTWVRDRQLASFELSVSIVELEGDQVQSIEFNRDLFDVTTITRLAGRFAVLLGELASDAERPLADLTMIGPSEQHQLLVEWNDSGRRDTPIHRCHELFAAHAQQTPDAVAVVAGERSLTYRELDRQAEILADHLRSLGARREQPVAIFIERSLEMVIGLLGILKAGAPYLPLDPSFPDQRLEFMLGDAFSGLENTIAVTSYDLCQRLTKLAGPTTRQVLLPLADGASATSLAREDASAVRETRASVETMAYVIYTSGSTGKPKGVQIPHRAVSNFLHSMAERPGLDRRDTILAVTTLAFDISVLEVFLPLIRGARLVVAERDQAADGQRLQQLLAASRATVMQATPATWRLLLETGWPGHLGLKSLCGGEALPAELAARLTEVCASVWNLYGPTETTVWSGVSPVRPSHGVTLGRPIANTRIHLLDRSLRPVPIGVAGETFIGERGLARGYLHRRSLSAERFVPNPFVDRWSDGAGARLYRVGDLTRRRPDGALEFLGRVDFQVKVRGYRIELGEIEAVLARHSAVGQGVVVVREDATGEPQLVAYFVAAVAEPPAVSELQDFLRQSLPDYMVPPTFVELDALPLTDNGKIDRKALPAPDRPMVAGGEYVAPDSNTEVALAELWQKLLNIDRIGRFDNFFQLGGHSFLALHLMTHIRSRFGVELPIAALFRAPTIEQLAALVDGETQQVLSALTLLGGRPTGGRPVFCIHGLGGHVFRLEPLARTLPDDRPFYGIQGWRDSGDLSHLGRIETMADAYLPEIVAAQPQGPYFLGGYSMGCMVAFEIARRLQAAGQTVAFIGLLDTPAKMATDPAMLARVSFEATLAQELRIPISMPRLAELAPEQRLGYVVEQGLESGTLPAGFTADDATAYIESFKRTFVAFMSYQIPTCPVKVTLFATEDDDVVGDDITQGWGTFAAEVEVISVPGDHVTMMRPPHVEELALEFAAAVDRAEALASARSQA